MMNRLAEYSRAAASAYRVRQDSNKPAKLDAGGGSNSGHLTVRDSLRPFK
jgi:hypothetical protein